MCFERKQRKPGILTEPYCRWRQHHSEMEENKFQCTRLAKLNYLPCLIQYFIYIYEPVTKGRDLKWDTLPQNQTPSKLFSVLPLESGMFQVTISIIKKWFWSKCVLYGIKTGVRSGVDVCNNGHSECHNNTEKNHLYAILMLLVHLSSC